MPVDVEIIWCVPSGGGGGPGPVGMTFNNLPGAVSVGDAVYVLPSAPPPPVPPAVARAFAGVLGQTPPAVGVVTVILSPTSCTVVSDGLMMWNPPLPPLAQGGIYYLSSTIVGGLTVAAPTAPGEFVQEIGTAVRGTALYLDVDATVVSL